MALDITAVSWFLPVFTWTLSFLVAFAILEKTKILGENKAINAIVGIVLALIFVSVSDVRLFVEAVTPWFVVLVLGIFFLAVFAMFLLKKPEEVLKPWVVWVFIILLALVFLLKGYNLFHIARNPDYLSVKNWITSPNVAGSLWFIIFAAATVFAVTKKAK